MIQVVVSILIGKGKEGVRPFCVLTLRQNFNRSDAKVTLLV